MFNTIVAIGIILLIVFLIAVIAAWVIRAPFAELVSKYSHIILRFIFAGAMIGSLIFEYVLFYNPCLLCWYQRIAIFSVAILLFTGDIRKSVLLRKQVIILSSLGFAIALLHNYIDIFPSSGIDICGAGPSCLARYIYEFGFITIPLMSAVVLLSGILLPLLARRFPQTSSVPGDQKGRIL
jgi:disulfide bond formation protein DsbB